MNQSKPYQNFWGQPVIHPSSKIAAFVEIGNGVVIGRDCKIEAFTFIPPGVLIEDNVFIGPHVVFTNDKHPKANDPDFKPLPTVVREGASIGANATILPGIVIGKNAVVGAGSVVTRDVPDGWTVVGNPTHALYPLNLSNGRDFYKIEEPAE